MPNFDRKQIKFSKIRQIPHSTHSIQRRRTTGQLTIDTNSKFDDENQQDTKNDPDENNFLVCQKIPYLEKQNM